MMKKTIVFLCTVILACGISVSAHALPYSGDHKWYVDGDAIWTAWSGQWVEYHVPSSDWEVNFGFVSVCVSANNTYKVKYTWLNDKYSPPLDANIWIASVFFDEKDRKSYMQILAHYCKKYSIEIWAYCLMENHVHLLVVPKKEESLKERAKQRRLLT